MSYPNPGLCRVSLHAETDAGALQTDLAVPAQVPVAALIPAILDILATRSGGRYRTRAGAPYRLSRPGAAALDGSKTMAQHAVRDGTMLLLTRTPAASPGPAFDDLTEQVSTTVRARARPWTPEAARSTAVLAGVGLAAVAGFVAVPGGPGAPNALLAATAAAAVAVLTIRLTESGGATMAAVCCLAVLAVLVTFTAVLTAVSPQATGALAAGVAVGLLQVAARLSIAFTGLMRQPGPSASTEDRAARAHDLLTGLVAACATTAALGTFVVAAGVHASGAPRFGGVAFAAATGAVLLLQSRSHTDRSRITALLAGGTVTLSVALVAGAAAVPQHRLWVCAAATALATTALCLGFAAPAPAPLRRRGVEALEYLALATLVPLACWICGCYGLIRGLNLT